MLEDMIIAKDRHKDKLARAERFRLSQQAPRPAPWLSKHYQLSLGRLAKLMVKWGDRLQTRYPDRTEPGPVPEPCGPGYCRLADPMQVAVPVRVQVR
jgi:hypothetical protein